MLNVVMLSVIMLIAVASYCDAIAPSLLALATLGGVTQIGCVTPLRKAISHCNIADICIQTSPM
jgi:hypothetical protein